MRRSWAPSRTPHWTTTPWRTRRLADAHRRGSRSGRPRPCSRRCSPGPSADARSTSGSASTSTRRCAGSKRASPPLLHTPHGSVRAERVVLAINAWSTELREYARKIITIGSEMGATAPCPEELDRIGWDHGVGITDAKMLLNLADRDRRPPRRLRQGHGQARVGWSSWHQVRRRALETSRAHRELPNTVSRSRLCADQPHLPRAGSIAARTGCRSTSPSAGARTSSPVSVSRATAWSRGSWAGRYWLRWSSSPTMAGAVRRSCGQRPPRTRQSRCAT